MNGPARAMPHATRRSAVLDVIRAAGTISRVGLTAATDLTGATISTVVRRLIDDGLVLETGRAESTGGKPRVLLQLNQSSRFAVGAHLDHLGISYVLTNLGGSVIARMSRAGAGREDPPVVVARMAREINALIEGVGVDRSRVLGLGLVTPGPLTPLGGMRLTPPSMQHWADFPLDTALENAVGLPVTLENDATASAIGEYWSGGVGAATTFAAVFMGTGIGAGLLVNGSAYRGASGNAGEIGHICLDLDGPECWCGARGCTEAVAGPAAVATRTLANILDLDLVVLTGPSLALAGAIYLPVVQAELDRSFFARATHPVTVQLSRSAAMAAAIGAAAIVLQSELVPLRQGLRLPENTGSEAVLARASAT